MQHIEYSFATTQYSENDYLETNCIDFLIFNNGDGIVKANNFRIAPGQSFGMTGNTNEIIKQNIILTFETATVYDIQYTRRFYVNQQF
jgi:hypothetical protein